MSSTNPVHALIRNADSAPDSIALANAQVTYTNAQFVDVVRRVAATLRAHGVQPGQVVGVIANPVLQATFAAATMHEAAVGFTATAPILDTYGDSVDFVFTRNPEFLAMHQNAILIDDAWLDALESIDTAVDVIDFPSHESLARIVFSSGTTGRPKGIGFTLGDLRARTDAAQRNWMLAQPFFAQLGIDTVSGMLTFLWSLIHGETYLSASEPATDVATIKRGRVAAIKTSPAKLRSLLEVASVAQTDMQSLEFLEIAGSLMPPALLQDVSRITGAEIIYLYGATEVGTLTRGAYDPDAPNAVGRVVDDADVEIVGDDDAPVAPGEVGRIRARAPHMSHDYWMSDSREDTGFHDGWFYPGDLGLFDSDERLRVIGRVDDRINLGGRKVDLGVLDLEFTSITGISDFAHVAVATEDGFFELVFAYVGSDTPPITVEQVVEHYRRNPHVRVLPRVVRVTEIPRNAFDKVLRKKLAAELG